MAVNTPPAPLSRGYTSTAHHAGHLTPGDQWRPLPDQQPRTVVTDLHRRHGVIVLTDQYGSTWTYPATGVIPTTTTRRRRRESRQRPDDPARSGRGVHSH